MEKYLSDEQIAASYIDFRVTEVHLDKAFVSGRVEVGLQIEFPHRENVWDNFFVYPATPTISCDHWYPEAVRAKLVAAVEYWAKWKCESCGNDAEYAVLDSDPEYMGMCGCCGYKDVGPRSLRT